MTTLGGSGRSRRSRSIGRRKNQTLRQPRPRNKTKRSLSSVVEEDEDEEDQEDCWLYSIQCKCEGGADDEDDVIDEFLSSLSTPSTAPVLQVYMRDPTTMFDDYADEQTLTTIQLSSSLSTTVVTRDAIIGGGYGDGYCADFSSVQCVLSQLSTFDESLSLSLRAHLCHGPQDEQSLLLNVFRGEEKKARKLWKEEKRCRVSHDPVRVRNVLQMHLRRFRRQPDKLPFWPSVVSSPLQSCFFNRKQKDEEKEAHSIARFADDVPDDIPMSTTSASPPSSDDYDERVQSAECSNHAERSDHAERHNHDH